MAQQRTTGISNRATPDEEARDRVDHPAMAPEAPPESPEGDGDMRDRELSNKVGTRSNAQKEAGTRHVERPAPGSHKVAGAFGKEERARDAEE
jgi:hypothetical protein